MRERILGRIHRALERHTRLTQLTGHPGLRSGLVPIGLEHRPKTALPEPLAATVAPSEALTLFTERLSGNGGEVVRLEGLGAAQEWLGHFAQTFAGVTVGQTVPESLRPRLPLLPPEEAPLGISWAVGAVAETGTVLLSSQEGRRNQLLPPTHLVFVSEAHIYPTLLTALNALKPSLPSAIGLHSGPSKSADIGQIMVKGVHGPGRLVVAVLSGS